MLNHFDDSGNATAFIPQHLTVCVVILHLTRRVRSVTQFFLWKKTLVSRNEKKWEASMCETRLMSAINMERKHDQVHNRVYTHSHENGTRILSKTSKFLWTKNYRMTTLKNGTTITNCVLYDGNNHLSLTVPCMMPPIVTFNPTTWNPLGFHDQQLLPQPRPFKLAMISTSSQMIWKLWCIQPTFLTTNSI